MTPLIVYVTAVDAGTPAMPLSEPCTTPALETARPPVVSSSTPPTVSPPRVFNDAGAASAPLSLNVTAPRASALVPRTSAGVLSP